MIILAYVALCVTVCVFKKVMPLVIGIGFAASWYLFFYGQMKMTAIILFALICLVTTLYRITMDDIEDTHIGNRVSRKETKKKETTVNTRWIYYLIPIFWPFLIGKAILGDKTRPTDMTPYDYEQHLKCNR